MGLLWFFQIRAVWVFAVLLTVFVFGLVIGAQNSAGIVSCSAPAPITAPYRAPAVWSPPASMGR